MGLIHDCGPSYTGGRVRKIVVKGQPRQTFGLENKLKAKWTSGRVLLEALSSILSTIKKKKNHRAQKKSAVHLVEE
jgi:hypothetical protein